MEPSRDKSSKCARVLGRATLWDNKRSHWIPRQHVSDLNFLMGMKGLEGKKLTGMLRTPCSISIRSYIKFVNYFSIFKGKGPLDTAQKSTAMQPQARQAHSHSTAHTQTRTRPWAWHALTFQWVCSSHKCISQLFCSLLLFLLFTPYIQPDTIRKNWQIILIAWPKLKELHQRKESPPWLFNAT